MGRKYGGYRMGVMVGRVWNAERGKGREGRE